MKPYPNLELVFWSSLVRSVSCLAVGILLLSSCQPPSKPSRLQPLPQDPDLQVYFNQSQAAEYPDPDRPQQRAGDHLEQVIIDALDQAQSSIEIAVQEFRLPRIARALRDRHRAGVKVRVILENTYSRPWSELTPSDLAQFDAEQRHRYEEFLALVDRNSNQQISPQEAQENDALIILKTDQIPWLDDTADGSKGSGLMHHKFIVIDQHTVIVTSANFTRSDIHGDLKKPDSRGNANNLLKIESSELANLLTQEFNLMWGDGPGGKLDSRFGLKKPQRPVQSFPIGQNRISVHFSPNSAAQPWSQTSNGLIAQTLNTATQTIDLALFVFSEQKLANTLETQSRKGVKIRAVLEPSFAYRPYSEALDLLGVSLNPGCKINPTNRPWQQPIQTVGVPILPPGDKLHHKFGVIDTQTVITGSHNWSEAANRQNDEILLVIENPRVAAHFNREFNRLYQSSELGISASLQQKIQQQQQRCSSGMIPTTGVIAQLRETLNTGVRRP